MESIADPEKRSELLLVINQAANFSLSDFDVVEWNMLDNLQERIQQAATAKRELEEKIERSKKALEE